MRRTTLTLITAVLLGVLALPAFGQQQPPDEPAGRPTEAQRDAVIRKMEAIRIARLTDYLRLDEKTAASFIPALTAIQRQRRDLARKNFLALRELRTLVNTPKPDERKLKETIASVEENHRNMMALRDREFEAARSSLTVEQQARFLLFRQEFQREMRGLMRNGRRGGFRRGRGPEPGTAGGAVPPPQQDEQQ